MARRNPNFLLDVVKMKQRRLELGFTQQDMAEQVPLSTANHYCRIETGKSPQVQAATLQGICRVLGLKSEDLLVSGPEPERKPRTGREKGAGGFKSYKFD